jgi:uncharacterized protein (TIGR03083 family)
MVEPLDDAALERSAYPTEWTIAQVLSHIGSGAVILQRRLDAGLDGSTMPDDFAPRVWHEWNAKTPRAQAESALAADDDVLVRLDALTGEERERFAFSMGPMTFDLNGFIGLRLNEHALHSWDIAVALDDDATIPPDLAELVVDNLGLIARFTGKPVGTPTTIVVRTTEPARTFSLALGDAVRLDPGALTGDTEIALPAEAFVRLVYGRLDPAHTPATATANDPALLERLRRTFPGP